MFPCSVCGRSFETVGKMRYHRKSHVTSVVATWPNGRSFVAMRDGEGSRFRCPGCSFATQIVDNARKHMPSKHTAEELLGAVAASSGEQLAVATSGGGAMVEAPVTSGQVVAESGFSATSGLSPAPGPALAPKPSAASSEG
ncbi:hypothetical protein EDC01DRAFT_788582 [Geopyxis carbonaria]|nr:hypothetical protein EDC01DRAFT_788582 [Geopyxis carbonaria]